VEISPIQQLNQDTKAIPSTRMTAMAMTASLPRISAMAATAMMALNARISVAICLPES
jgi:hypothetical protein